MVLVQKLAGLVCIGDGLCHVLPNGDVEFHVSGADRCTYVIAKEEVANPTAKPINSTCRWERK